MLVGCGEDPVLTAAREQAGEQKPAGPGDPETPGKPGEPAPGIPDQPPPGEGGAPGEIVPPGEAVLIQGVVHSEAQGVVVIDVFDGDHSAGNAGLVARKQLDGAGAYTLKVPKDSEVWISAYADVDGDGKPSPGDARGSAPNPVATGEGREGLDLTLE